MGSKLGVIMLMLNIVLNGRNKHANSGSFLLNVLAQSWQLGDTQIMYFNENLLIRPI